MTYQEIKLGLCSVLLIHFIKTLDVVDERRLVDLWFPEADHKLQY